MAVWPALFAALSCVLEIELEKPPLHPDDPNIVGVATDQPGSVHTRLPVLDLADRDAIATFVRSRAAGWPVAD